MNKIKVMVKDDVYTKLLEDLSSSKTTLEIQRWVDNIQVLIGSEVYDNIKKEFRQLEDAKKTVTSRMHCTQSFAESPQVKFKNEVAGTVILDDEVEDFKDYFKTMFMGVVDINDNSATFNNI